MAPAKRTAVEAHPLEDSLSTIPKQKLAAQAQLVARSGGGRRNGQNPTQPNAEKFSTSNLSALASASEAASSVPATNASSGMVWQNEPRSLLATYRSAYRLSTPTCYRNKSAHLILASGIGSRAPIMASSKEKRRVPKQDLAKVVAKHFKEAPAQEMDALVELMYKVKNKDKTFRLKFLPKVSR